MHDNDLNYHTARARNELDFASRAERQDVAEAHRRLSALHMERVQELSALQQCDRQIG